MVSAFSRSQYTALLLTRRLITRRTAFSMAPLPIGVWWAQDRE